MRSTLLSPIQRSGLSLPTSAVRPCSLARRPTLEGTSPTTLRSGPRWSSSQGLRRIDAAEHSINPVLRTVRGTDVRELPRTRRVALRELALRCWRARRLRPTCATSTVSGRWTGQRRRVRCAAPAAFLYVCGVKKHTQLVTQRADGPGPTANPKQLTGPRESVDSPIDGRSLQIDLVRLDRGVPTAGRVGSRKPCPSPSAQRAAAQIPEAGRAQQHRPAVACWALSPGSRAARRPEDYQAGDAAALAPCRLPSLLEMEIPPARWPAADTGGHSPPHSRNECRQPAMGRSADPRRTAQAWHRCRTDHGRKVYGEEEDAAVAGLEDLPSQSCRRHRIDGSVPGPDDFVSAVVRIANPATQSPQASVARCNPPSEPPMDSPDIGKA